MLIISTKNVILKQKINQALILNQKERHCHYKVSLSVVFCIGLGMVQ
jgi:hypothetical protein